MKNRIAFPLLIGLLVSLLFSPNAFSEDTTDAVREALAARGWSLPQGLFTDVAVTKNATYFVWKPNTPESDGSDIPYKSTITLNIPGTETETAKELQDKGELPAKYPYFMVPLPTTPAEDAAAADAILTAEGVLESFFTNSLDSLLNKVVNKTIGTLNTALPLLRLNPLSMVGKMLYGTFQESIEKAEEVEAAYALITMGLQNPAVTVEDYSEFACDDRLQNGNSEARYLVMIPEPLEELTLNMETYYYAKSAGRIQLMIRKDTSGDSADGGLFGGLFGGLLDEAKDSNMHLFWSNDENGEIIRLNVPAGDEHNPHNTSLENLLKYWTSEAAQNNTEYWDLWKGEWKNNDETIDSGVKSTITKWFSDTISVLERLELGDVPLDTLLDASNSSSLNFLVCKSDEADESTFYMELPKYVDVPDAPIETADTFQLQSAAAAAPQVHLMSLADYSPFQELSPGVQALLLDDFEKTTRSETIELDWNSIPEQTALLSNYPNPFNPETWIPYQLAKPADVRLTIYDINGRIVRILALGHQRAGMYHGRSRAAYWDGRNAVGEPVASGVYFYTLKAGDFSATRKMLIRK